MKPKAVMSHKNKIRDSLEQQDPSELFDVPTDKPTTVPELPRSSAQAVLLKKGMAVRNVKPKKKPEKYVPSMKGKKYTIALTQIVASLKESKDAMLMAHMSVKPMSNRVHCNADIIGHGLGSAVPEGSHQEVG